MEEFVRAWCRNFLPAFLVMLGILGITVVPFLSVALVYYLTASSLAAFTSGAITFFIGIVTLKSLMDVCDT